MWIRRRRTGPEPDQLGDLTFWESTDEDGDGQLLWAEMSTEPNTADAVAEVKNIMRQQGWTQLVGD